MTRNYYAMKKKRFPGFISVWRSIRLCSGDRSTNSSVRNWCPLIQVQLDSPTCTNSILSDITKSGHVLLGSCCNMEGQTESFLAGAFNHFYLPFLLKDCGARFPTHSMWTPCIFFFFFLNACREYAITLEVLVFLQE